MKVKEVRRLKLEDEEPRGKEEEKTKERQCMSD